MLLLLNNTFKTTRKIREVAEVIPVDKMLVQDAERVIVKQLTGENDAVTGRKVTNLEASRAYVVASFFKAVIARKELAESINKQIEEVINSTKDTYDKAVKESQNPSNWTGVSY